MDASFTVLWTNDYCKRLRRAGDAGQPLSAVFSGQHSSQPSLTKYGVERGDFIYPVRVESGRLFVLGRMRVKRYVSMDVYLCQVMGLPDSYLELRSSQLHELLSQEHPEWGHRLPWGCASEVAIGESGSLLDFDTALSPSAVERVRFTSRRGTRPIKHAEGGVIRNSVSLQGGVYRLMPESARELEMVIGPEMEDD